MAAKSDCVPKLKDLLYELRGVDWNELGIQLDVPRHVLNSIIRDNPTEARKLSEVLQYWLNNGEASWKVIIKALKRIGGHKIIIEVIESEYCGITQSYSASPVDVSGTTRLSEGHHTRLISQLNEHAANWREIGINLGFHQGELMMIECKPLLIPQAPDSYLRALLSQWLQWAPGDHRGSNNFATLEALKSAVSKAGLGKLAADLNL